MFLYTLINIKTIPTHDSSKLTGMNIFVLSIKQFFEALYVQNAFKVQNL